MPIEMTHKIFLDWLRLMHEFYDLSFADNRPTLTCKKCKIVLGPTVTHPQLLEHAANHPEVKDGH